jgi:hypothetical protein
MMTIRTIMIIALCLAGSAARAQETADDSLYFSPSLHLQPVDVSGTPYYDGPADYPLHEGLNVSLGMRVESEFGKHARSGVGFGQTVSATYLKPLTKHLWLTAGGYIDHVLWGGDSYTSAGINGELDYQFDPHWAAYLYGQKTFVHDGGFMYGRFGGTGYGSVYSPFNIDALSDKLGAGVRWTPNPSFSLQVQVEKNWWPSSRSMTGPGFWR